MNLSIMVKNYKGKVCNMYQDEYKRWLAADLEDADLKPEDRKSTRLNSSHNNQSRMPSSA